MLESVLDSLQQLGRENQVIAGVMSLYGLGVLTYVLKGIPTTLYGLIQKHATTSLTITNTHTAFHNLMDWFEQEGYSSKFRRIKLTNGRFGYDHDTTKGVGYGSHFIWYNHQPILIKLEKEETKGDYDKETLTLTKLGRSHEVFNQIVKRFLKVEEKENELVVYAFNKSSWEIQQKQRKRPLTSVYIESGKKNVLLTTLNNFQQKESWYLKHNIPYRLGILLHGPPGTGKTSLIKSIAAYTNKNLCILPASRLQYLLLAVESLPKNSVLVIEDIDSNSSTHKRKSMFSDTTTDSSSDTTTDSSSDTTTDSSSDIAGDNFDLSKLLSLSDGGLSEILNAIDGIADTHGRILVITTNNPRQLDSALIRPGRIDLKLELGYASNEVFVLFMQTFFDDLVLPKRFEIKEGVAVSDLQQSVLMGEDQQEIFSKYLTVT